MTPDKNVSTSRIVGDWAELVVDPIIARSLDPISRSLVTILFTGVINRD